MVPQAIKTELDQIAAYITSPEGAIDLPEHLERRAHAYTIIASLLVQYPFKTQEEIGEMVKKTLPELTKGTLYNYIRDTKFIYGNLDKIDRGFERLMIKTQIGKAIDKCYQLDDMRPVPNLIKLWIQLYRLDRPDSLTPSIEELKDKVINIFQFTKNEFKVGETVHNLEDYVKTIEIQLAKDGSN